MSEELATLERRIAVVGSKVDLVLAQLAEMNRTGKPGMTQREFAKLIRRSPRTVSRMVKGRKLRLERGLVPNSEVRRFLS